MTDSELRRVLFLDDDPAVLSLLAARLHRAPLHLVLCSELEAAETLLDHLRFGVIVVDLEVSELGGLEGMRLIRHAVTNFPETTVLIFSGQITPLAQSIAASMGVRELFEKPHDLGRLLKLVEDLTTDPFSEPAAEESQRLSIIEPLEQIIDDKRISSVFQPIFRLGRNGSPLELFGIEALSRGPAGSMLENPMMIFDYAVRKELTFQTDMLCIERALESSLGTPEDVCLFINSHPRAMSHPDYVPALQNLLDRNRVVGRQIVLEVTEQSAIVDTDELAGILRQARDQGIKIALDDYGEGSSNLHLIHDLKPEYLKITGRFCDCVDREPVKQALIRSAVSLAGDLEMETIMERVETDEELSKLRQLGIDFGQGYHLGRPQAAEQLAKSFAAEHLGNGGEPSP